MGLRDRVAKKKAILTHFIIKGALGCKTPAYWRRFFVSWAKAWRGRPQRSA